MGPSAVIGSLLIKLGIDPSGMSDGVNKAQGPLAMLQKHSTLATAGAGAAVGDFMATSAQRAVQFDDQMRQVFSIMPDASQEAMDKMKAQVRDLSKEYGVATETVIPGMYDALSSGIDQSEIFDFMETAQKMAVAGVADTQQSVNLLAQVKNAYRLTGDEMEGVSDQMFMAVNKGVTTIPELSSALSAVTPIAASMGIGIEDVLATITAMTLQGSSTAESVTMMRSSLVALLKPLPPLAKGLKAAGYESGQAAIDALGYQGAMELVRDISERTGITLPKLTGRIEGTSAVLQLTGENAVAARKAIDDIGDAAGTTDAAFKIMNGGVGGVARRLQAALQDLSLTVGQALEPIAPIFMAFGPQVGRWIGRGVGAGLALGLKGIGSIVSRALPSLAANLTELGAEAGGGWAKAFGASIGSSIKSAGWKKLAFGGIAIAGGMALQSGALGDFGGIEKVVGPLMTVAGAFAIGGPVMAGLAAIVVALGAVSDFLGKVEDAQGKLNEQVAGIAGKSSQEALGDLQNLTQYMHDAQGLNRIIGDTFAGEQQVESLTALTDRIIEAKTLSVQEIDAAITAVYAAAVEAGARGNAAVEGQLRMQARVLEQMRTDARGAADGIYRAMTTEVVPGSWGDSMAQNWAGGYRKVETAIESGAGGVTAAAESAQSTISAAWDTVTNALSQGPKVKSMGARMKAAGKAVSRSISMLQRAVRKGDVVAAAYYTDAVGEAKKARHALRSSASDVMADARKVLGRGKQAAGRIHRGMAQDAKRESGRGARDVKRNAQKAGKAMPEEMAKAKPKAATAAKGVATAVETPLQAAAGQAQSWGAHLGTNYASGIQQSIPIVAAAAAALAAAAATPIKFSSPPRSGPLSTIRSWGPHMVAEWTRPTLARVRDVERVGEALGRAMSPRALMPAVSGTPGWDRASAAGIRALRDGGTRRGRENHYHIGTLIADDRGLDRLDQRMTRRRKLKSRGAMRFRDVD